MPHRPEGTYTGSAWNSRFLYAPKVALELAARGDFAELRALADVKLGLKTGADGFFFLHPAGASGSQSHRRVQGFQDWTGNLAKSDLQVAVRNPRDLVQEGKHVFQVPRNTGEYYLYPTGNLNKAQLREYVSVGEQSGVHAKTLVRDNAGDHWFVQARGIVRPDWIVPYNSAYDYFACENSVQAVINGRFVGVVLRENEGIDTELLGAALNSTFVIATRLIEGVPTGNEGAFDVGPPAARLMKLPDVRKMSGAGGDVVKGIVAELRDQNELPPAPDRTGSVVEIRRRLDDALLMALGVGGGDRAVFLDRLYKSYGRWRAAVEDVEMRMRANRRATARMGLSRGQSTVTRTSRRVAGELVPDFPLIPVSLLEDSDEFDSVRLADGYQSLGQDALFGEGFLPDGRGNVVDLSSAARVEYGMLLRDLGFGRDLDIIRDEGRAQQVVAVAREAIARFHQQAAERALEYVDRETAPAVMVATDQLWFERCRVAYSEWKETASETRFNVLRSEG